MAHVRETVDPPVAEVLVEGRLSTGQLPVGWLNDEALRNVPYIVVTPEVSHALMSSLKEAAAE